MFTHSKKTGWQPCGVVEDGRYSFCKLVWQCDKVTHPAVAVSFCHTSPVPLQEKDSGNASEKWAAATCEQAMGKDALESLFLICCLRFWSRLPYPRRLCWRRGGYLMIVAVELFFFLVWYVCLLASQCKHLTGRKWIQFNFKKKVNI